MEKLLKNLIIRVPEALFLKNPESSELGKRIVRQGIIQIDELGFEHFTFRKLSQSLGSPESTLYRYFENKHMLLVYLSSWYWSWMEYQITLSIANVKSSEVKLQAAVEVLTQRQKESEVLPHIPFPALQRIMIAESSKSFQTKEIDRENKDGHFQAFKSLVTRISGLIEEYNSFYPHPCSLASLLLIGIHQQRFLQEHMPTIGDIESGNSEATFFYRLLKSTASYGSEGS